MIQEIISPISRELLKQELAEKATLLRHSRKGGTDLYIFDGNQCPNLMREVGRLREIAFREAGGGTGLDCDIDAFDILDKPYMQLIVWEPQTEEILGGYRYIYGPDIAFDADGQPKLATSHMFHYSEKFCKDYLPSMIELGRSFVVVDRQSSRSGARSLFTLDNLWDGLGALAVTLKGAKYFYGKFTMYPTYPQHGRNMILYFLKKWFPDPDQLITPFHPLETHTDNAAMQELFCYSTFHEDYKVLNGQVRQLGYNIPPLVNAYMLLSPTMKMFGTAINDEFGDVEESGILITIDDIFTEKHERYIDSFKG